MGKNVLAIIPATVLAIAPCALETFFLCSAAATPRAVDAGKFFPTIPNRKKPSASIEGMVWIPGGEFSMGAQTQTASTCPLGQDKNIVRDAQPIHRVYVDGFWMDQTEVTNQEFAKFVSETGYKTLAERPIESAPAAGTPITGLVAGGVVFSPPGIAVPLENPYAWWRFVPGANWQHPSGPQSSIEGKDNLPVVQIAFEDAEAYAKWAGKRLPTEAEFEFAARGGLAGKLYSWGDEFLKDGRYQANTFQGEFPNSDSGADGFVGAAPVKSYPANGYGLYDMAGNVWEWCHDRYRPDYYSVLAKEKKAPKNPQGPDSSFDPAEPTEEKRVQRGGSYLCADQYCARYLVGSRGRGEPSTGTNHVGFRCVR